MDKILIKKWLLNKKPRVYSIIVQAYYDKLSAYRTALFIEWLAEELDVPNDAINISSISSALRRHRKRLGLSATENNALKSRVINKNKNEFDTDLPDRISFQ